MAGDWLDEAEWVDDAGLIARQVVASKTKLNKYSPVTADLQEAITEITIGDTIHGSSTLTVQVVDPQWTMLDSGFFDADENGRLDPIDVKYGTDSTGDSVWWRLTQCNPSSSGIVTMVFMERPAVYLMQHQGPVKATRGKVTRAEFLEMIHKRIKKSGGVRFHSKDIDVKQPVESDRKDKKKEEKQRKREKSPGISTDEDLKIKGKKATKAQLRQVERSLDAADDIPDVPHLALLAMMVAGIGESAFAPVMNAAGSSYGGVFQGNVAGGVFDIDDTEGMARCFLKGGKGFQQGGAIHLANTNPHMDPGEIATRVEASGQPGSFYGRYKKEGLALIDAYGGGGGGGTVYRKKFHFTIGGPDNPHENFWDGANRLAEEVNWAYFIDGNDVYFDPETTLIKQKPVAVIDRRGDSVLDYDITWDTRKIATEMTLTLICDPFEFRAGQVFKLRGFGPASTGSTAKLPGRWLITEYERSPHDISTAFTLKQPEKPKREPLAELGERLDANLVSGDVDRDMSPKQIIDDIVLPMAREVGIAVTPLSVQQANARHGTTISGSRSDHQGPPSQAWAADMSNGSSPTKQMDRLAQLIADKFDIDWNGSGAISKTGDGFRYQLIYRSMVGGNHFNHVHFGVKKL